MKTNNFILYIQFNSLMYYHLFSAKNSVLNFVSYIKDAGWASALKDEFQKDYFKDLEVLLQKDYKKGVQVFPPKDLIFNAFNKTPLDQVSVIIYYCIEGYFHWCKFLKVIPPSLC